MQVQSSTAAQHMGDFTLDEGFTLPEKDSVEVLPDSSAEEYARTIAASKTPVSKQDTASIIDRERALIKEGQLLERREVNRVSSVVSKQQDLTRTTAAAFDSANDAVGVLNGFQEQNEALKKLELEDTVIEQFGNSDALINQLLHEGKDAIKTDDKRLTNEMVFHNLTMEESSKAEGFFANMADFFEVLGPSQIDQMINNPKVRVLHEELQIDKKTLSASDFRTKWEAKVKELRDAPFFDNQDVLIGIMGILDEGSLYQATRADAFNALAGGTSIGIGTGIKLLRSGVHGIATKRALGAPAQLSGRPSVTPGVSPELSSFINRPITSTVDLAPLPAGVGTGTRAAVQAVEEVTPELLAQAGGKLSRKEVKELKSSLFHLKQQRAAIGGKNPKSKVKKELAKENELKQSRLQQQLDNHVLATKAEASISRIETAQRQASTPAGSSRVAQAVTSAIKGKSFLGEVAVRAGGSARIGQEAAESILTQGAGKGSTVFSGSEEVSYALQGLTPAETLNTVPAEVARALQRGDRILGTADNLAIDAVADEVKRTVLLTKLEATLGANSSNAKIVNVRHSDNSLAGLDTVTSIVGTDAGLPFATKAIADDTLKAVGMKGKVIQDPATKGFYIEITQDGIGALTEESIKASAKAGWFRAAFTQPSEFIDKNIQLLARGSEMSMTKVHALFKEIWNKGIKPMSGQEARNVEEVMQHTMRKAEIDGVPPQWLTPDDFIAEYEFVHGKLPTNKQVLGYLTIKQIEDASWRILNRAVYKSKFNQGLSDYKYLGKTEGVAAEFSAKPVLIGDLGEGAIILEESTGKLLHLGKRTPAGITREAFEKLLEGKSLLRLDEEVGLGKDGLANYIIGDVKSFKSSPLKPNQVGYLGGGRVKYDYNWVIHAQRNRTYSFLGDKKVSLNPVALFGGKTRKEVKAFAERLNAGRKVALDEKAGLLTKAEANAAIQALKFTNGRFQTTKQLEEFLTSRGVQLKDDIVANADGDIPTANGIQVASDGEKARAGIRNRVSKARTDNRLEDVNGGYGILSPFESTATNTSIVSRHAAFSEFRRHTINMFSNAFGKHMTVQPRAGQNPIDVLESAISQKALQDLSTSEIAQIKAHQRQILDTLRSRRPAERMWSNVMDSMSDVLLGTKLPLNSGERLARTLADKRSASPISAWKGVAFQARMGLFALPQLALQASMAPTIAAISPRHGLAAMVDVIPLRMALQAKDPEMLAYLAQKLNKGRLWSKDESGDFLELVEMIKDMGVIEYGASLPELAGSVTGNVATSKSRDLMDMAQIFFREGENIPRLTASGIAARMIRAKGIKLSSAEGKAMFITEVNRLTFGITGADVQIGLRGLAAAPTQFWSYPTRMISSLFGKEFTAGEKARMWGSFAFLYGAGGIPFGDELINQVQTQFGVELSQEEALALYNGAVDSAIFAATDGEVKSDFSGRMLGGFVPQVIETFSENPLMTFLGGPTGKGISDGFEAAARELRPIAAYGTGTLDQVGSAALAFLGANITSVDKFTRGWLAYETGILQDRKGRGVVEMPHSSQILAWQAGLGSQEFSDIYTQGDLLRDLVIDRSGDLSIEMFQLTRKIFSDPENAEIYHGQLTALGLIAKNNGIFEETINKVNVLRQGPVFQREKNMRFEQALAEGKNLPTTPSSRN